MSENANVTKFSRIEQRFHIFIFEDRCYVDTCTIYAEVGSVYEINVYECNVILKGKFHVVNILYPHIHSYPLTDCFNMHIQYIHI